MLCETNAIFSQSIDIGRFYFLLPVATKFGIAKVIGEDVDDVGLLLGVKSAESG